MAPHRAAPRRPPQVSKLRADARQARGAEADSSVGMHQLEARLAVAAIEHKQDVRRLQETIEVRLSLETWNAG